MTAFDPTLTLAGSGSGIAHFNAKLRAAAKELGVDVVRSRLGRHEPAGASELMQPTHVEWDKHVLAMVHALAGKITPNMRMVSIAHTDGKWSFKFLLSKETDKDQEAIEDAMADFESLQMVGLHGEVEITVSADPFPQTTDRIIFKRRER